MTDRSSLVCATLDQVAELSSSEFRGDDAVLRRLIADYGDGEGVANQLWADLPNGYLREHVASLFALWSWRGNDNGAGIMRTLESWVRECSDETKVWVALHQDAYPFVSHADRIYYLTKVIERFPSLRSRCEAMITQSQDWDKSENLASRRRT